MDSSQRAGYSVLSASADGLHQSSGTCRVDDSLPSIRDLLAQAAKLSCSEMLALFCADQRKRWQAGQPCLAEMYLQELAGRPLDEEMILDLVFSEVFLREEYGEAPQAEEYQQRFPQYAEQMHRQFLVHQALASNLAEEDTGTQQTSQATPAVETADAENQTGACQPGTDLAQKRGSGGTGFPQNVPGYRVLTVIGHGGMGVVYKARQIKLNRLVALKMIRAGADVDEEHLTRFRTEAEAVARLQHPNIVQIYEIGEYNGLPYFSLEFCDGGSLDKKLGGTPQPPKEAAQLVKTLAHAVHAAHQAGIIHRDLKPANILLQASGAENQESPAAPHSPLPTPHSVPKITDFGLAKRLDVSSAVSRTGEIMGTPSYMAPEQAKGEVHEIGPATDVYALTAIFYDMLTGRPPFKGSSILETLEQVRTQDPVPPTRLQGKIPRDLETICLKGLRKDPQQRYASALALADDLDRFLDGRSILARPVPLWERTFKWMRRRPAQAALVASVVLAIFATTSGAVFYALYLARQTELERVARGKIDHFQDAAQVAENAGCFADARNAFDQIFTILDSVPNAAGTELRQRIIEGRNRVQQKIQEQNAVEQLAIARRDFEERKQRFRSGRTQVLFRSVSFRAQDAAGDAAVVCTTAPAVLREFDLQVSDRPEDIVAGLARYRPIVEKTIQLDEVAADCYQVLLVWALAELNAAPNGVQTVDADAVYQLPSGALLLASPRLERPLPSTRSRRSAFLMLPRPLPSRTT